jgi:hypothetical protein
MKDTRTNSRRLRDTIRLTGGPLSQRIYEFWSHPQLGNLYPEFLFGLYGTVVASTPVIRHAAIEAERLSPSDDLARRLTPYLHDHADEEQGHDEWLLEDLAVLDFDRDRVFNRLPFTSVSALVGSQYYLARHVHPVAILGYIAVLENPAAPEFLESVAERNGLPMASMSTLLRHARLDEGHVAEFDRMLDSLAVTPLQRDVMTASAIACVSHLEAFFVEVLEHFSRMADGRFPDGFFYRDTKSPASDAIEVADGQTSGHSLDLAAV